MGPQEGPGGGWGAGAGPQGPVRAGRGPPLGPGRAGHLVQTRRLFMKCSLNGYKASVCPQAGEGVVCTPHPLPCPPQGRSQEGLHPSLHLGSDGGEGARGGGGRTGERGGGQGLLPAPREAPPGACAGAGLSWNSGLNLSGKPPTPYPRGSVFPPAASQGRVSVASLVVSGGACPGLGGHCPPACGLRGGPARRSPAAGRLPGLQPMSTLPGAPCPPCSPGGAARTHPPGT